MAKITRKTQKQFGGSAANNQQFGSANAGGSVSSDDPDVLQALAAYENGWNDAVISGDRLPVLGEMQGLQYVLSRQIAYTLQEGISEYDAGTTYYTNSIVKQAGTYRLYGSVTNDNIGNALTNGANWSLLQDLSSANQQATETSLGVAEIATQAETDAGTNDLTIVTPLKLATSNVPYNSPNQTITSGGTLTLAHGLGVAPSNVYLDLVCVTAQFGYNIGDVVKNVSYGNSTSGIDDKGYTFIANSSNVIVEIGHYVKVFTIIRRDTNASGALTNSSWRIVVRASK